MSKRYGTVLALFASMLVSLAAAAPAGAANFAPAPGVYTADTTALTLTGPGTSITGSNVGGVAVFSFDNVNIPAGVTLEAEGSLPLKIVASGEMQIAGVIEAGGFSGVDMTAGPNEGGPGGGAGGANGTEAGGGPGGGGKASDENNGGGGGGFGGHGAVGGIRAGNLGTAGVGGVAYGDPNTLLQGGSGGAGGSISGAVGGGGGGGAIALFASTLKIAAGGEVNVDGGNGAVGNVGASGGGSGGAILLHAQTMQVDGTLSAVGGGGGRGGCCGAGGGGGGGRIAYQYGTLAAAGTADVAGGPSGAISTTSCCTGTTGASLEPAGAAGVVTKVQGPSATTGLATSVESTTATLNATVGPNSNATSYHFDFGTTTAYGSRVPSSDASVGSDSSQHGVSQAITGLAPNTSYHYRVVATDALGFVTTGADFEFKTPACIVPKLKGKSARAARKALKKAHCKAGKVKKRFSGKVKKRRVIKQTIKPGKVLPVGAKVGLKVSKGEK